MPLVFWTLFLHTLLLLHGNEFRHINYMRGAVAMDHDKAPVTPPFHSVSYLQGVPLWAIGFPMRGHSMGAGENCPAHGACAGQSLPAVFARFTAHFTGWYPPL